MIWVEGPRPQCVMKIKSSFDVGCFNVRPLWHRNGYSGKNSSPLGSLLIGIEIYS